MSSTQINKQVYQKWNTQDKKLFIKLHKVHGTAFEKYQSSFPSRTVQQIRSFYYNEINQQKNNRKKSKKNFDFPQSQFVFDELQEPLNRSENGNESLHLSNDFFE
ncbi:Conserved_hypothetical protein [Hexamita inflata]|uniref:Myb-like domain-containing protein n=1 Tax=Hexamita inflata TaxID=28002 RepID=A0AA86TAW7_9EUKA|nr:Conserved hypothetical protein [Hexamita inflata]